MIPVDESQPSVPVQLAVINVKLDTLLVQRDDHETRLRKLEQFRWVLAGAVAAGSTAGATLVARVIGA